MGIIKKVQEHMDGLLNHKSESSLTPKTAVSAQQPKENSCPICGSTEFKDYRNRKNAKCLKCGALERTRALWMVYEHYNLQAVKGPVLHFAPELAIAQKLVETRVNDYRPSDIDLTNFKDYPCEVRIFDITTEAAEMEENSVGGVIHSHVFEHLPCNIYKAFADMNRIIRPGGYHLFIVPFFGDGYYSEDLSPLTTDEERTEKFGQFDHVRAFGWNDFDKLFGPAFEGFERVPVETDFSSSDLESICIRGSSFIKAGGANVFLYRKL